MTASLTELHGGYRLPDTMCFDLASTHSGKLYRIFVSPPQGDMPSCGWPVLYLTDGNACFPIAAAAHAIQSPYPQGTNIEHGIIVAIGYPTEAPFDLMRRSWDLSPPPGRSYPPYSAGGQDVVTGGAEEFLTFIETELKPEIAARFSVDTARQTLFGHSFGGLFALYALFNRPQSFTRYVAASPSIFWEECRILDFERDFSLKPNVGTRFLHLSAGEFEGDRLAPFQMNADDANSREENMKKARTAAYAQEMAHRLAAYIPPDLAVRYETFSGENHLSVMPTAIGRALQIAFERVEVMTA